MSIHLDKQRKTYYVKWRERNKVNGKVILRTKRGFSTKKEARLFEEEVLSINEFASFSQLTDLYIDSLKGYANDDTRNRKKIMIHKYANELLPLNVRNISKADILKWLNGVALLDKSITTKNHIIQSVKAVSKFGADYYDYPNFAKTLKAFPKTSNDIKEIQIISRTDFQKIVNCVDNEVYKRFFIFLYNTGCRRGEAMALTKADICDKRANLNKSIRYFKNGFTPLKNVSSKRSILLSDIAYQSLEPLLLEDGDFVFGGLEPLSPSSITRYFNDALKKSNMPHYRIHDLRHSFISNAILNGIDIVSVSKYVGHSNIEMTLNRYSHLLKDSEFKMVDKLNVLNS